VLQISLVTTALLTLAPELFTLWAGIAAGMLRTIRTTIPGISWLDDRFHETGPDEASIHGTGIMLVDFSFEKS
jgi:hypothetical protein